MVKKKKRSTGLLEPAEPEGSYASYRAIVMTQNKFKFYFATIPANDIFPYCFVSRREEDPIKGFQRNLNYNRAKEIARYLDEKGGSIPTNLVLSAQDVSEMLYDSKNQTIKYCRQLKSFLVLDGQHRLYGYGYTKKQYRIPVAIYDGLSRKDEATIFIDINTTQKGVPGSLLLDIKQVAEKETDIEKELRSLFDRLNNDSQSVLAGLMSPSSSTKGKLTRVAFNRGARDIVTDKVVAQLDSDETKYKLVRNYFSALEQVLDTTDYFVKAAYFEAFCGLFSEVLKESYARFNNYKIASIKDVLLPLSSHNLVNSPTIGHARHTKKTILKTLKDAITTVHVTEDMI